MSHTTSAVAVPGVVMRLAQRGPKDTGSLSQEETAVFSQAPFPNVQTIYTAHADDDKTPSLNTIYVLSDINPVLSSPEYYEQDVKAFADSLTSVSWVVCAFVNGRDRGGDASAEPSTVHPLPGPPANGSIIVVNGSTPRPGKEQDYHEWYNQEHGPGLSVVPGWTSARRYSLEKLYGDVETASFYGFNYYEAQNGLGGPEWQASTKTEWTQRIRGNAAKPNIRRVWRVGQI